MKGRKRGEKGCHHGYCPLQNWGLDCSQCFLLQIFMENIIKEGCHAYFGMYGTQDGDGIPTITNEEQIRITADAIAEMMGCRR